LVSPNTATAKVRSHKVAPKIPLPLNVSETTMQRLIDVFKLLADKSRMKILMALAKGGEMHVTALRDVVNQSQPAVSHHLTMMRMTGLVGFRRDGKHNYYHLESGQLGDLLEQLFTDCGNDGRRLQFEDFVLSYKRAR